MSKQSDDIKIYIDIFTPNTIEILMKKTEEFLNNDNPKATKDFSDYQKAMKISISNLEQLLKFQKWADEQERLDRQDQGENSTGDENISKLIETAKTFSIEHEKNFCDG